MGLSWQWARRFSDLLFTLVTPLTQGSLEPPEPLRLAGRRILERLFSIKHCSYRSRSPANPTDIWLKLPLVIIVFVFCLFFPSALRLLNIHEGDMSGRRITFCFNNPLNECKHINPPYDIDICGKNRKGHFVSFSLQNFLAL